MSDSAEQIFAGLIADRGGLQRFDETQRQICRRISLLLSDDSSDFNASALNVLLSLLPEKSAGPEYDLTKLTDKQFEQLDYITAVAAGLKPPTPEKKRHRPLRSAREIWAALYAHDVDQIQAEFENAFRQGVPFALTDFDRATIHNACYLMMELFARPEDIWPHIAQDAEYAERRRWLDKEAAAETAITRVKDILGPAPEAKPEPSNVVTPPQWGAFVTKRLRGSGPPWSDGGALY